MNEPTVILEDSNLSSPEKFIGEGGNGKIYRVEKNGFVYAVKKIKKANLRHGTRERQLHRQINILEKVQHPNIVGLYGVETDEKCYNIRMEYLEGQSLTDFILNNQLSIQQNRRFGVKVTLDYISALSALRRHQIVNRDIKPDNVMVNIKENGDILVKMIDLGEARRVGNIAKTFVGSYGYMSPQVYKNSQYTETCDIWSLGVTLFQVFQGLHPEMKDKKRLCFPFRENILLASEEKQKQFYEFCIKSPLSLSVTRIPDLIRHLIRQMLRPDPLKRITFLQILYQLEIGLQTLSDCLSEEEILQYRSQLLNNCIQGEKKSVKVRDEQRMLQKKIESLHKDLFQPFKQAVKLDRKDDHDDILLFMNHLVKEISSTLEELSLICDIEDLEECERCITNQQIVEMKNFYAYLQNCLQMRKIDHKRDITMSEALRNFIRQNFGKKQLSMRALINELLRIK